MRYSDQIYREVFPVEKVVVKPVVESVVPTMEQEEFQPVQKPHVAVEVNEVEEEREFIDERNDDNSNGADS